MSRNKIKCLKTIDGNACIYNYKGIALLMMKKKKKLCGREQKRYKERIESATL